MMSSHPSSLSWHWTFCHRCSLTDHHHQKAYHHHHMYTIIHAVAPIYYLHSISLFCGTLICVPYFSPAYPISLFTLLCCECVEGRSLEVFCHCRPRCWYIKYQWEEKKKARSKGGKEGREKGKERRREGGREEKWEEGIKGWDSIILLCVPIELREILKYSKKKKKTARCCDE